MKREYICKREGITEWEWVIERRSWSFSCRDSLFLCSLLETIMPWMPSLFWCLMSLSFLSDAFLFLSTLVIALRYLMSLYGFVLFNFVIRLWFLQSLHKSNYNMALYMFLQKCPSLICFEIFVLCAHVILAYIYHNSFILLCCKF